MKMRNIILLLLALAGALAILLTQSRLFSPPLSSVTIALPTQINSSPMIVAHAKGLFKKAGVEVISQPFLLGKDALKSVLDGKADLAVVADTPFIFAYLSGSDIAMVAGISQARRALAVVTRNDRGINRLQDLVGKSVGLTKGTNLPYFFDALLHFNNVSTDSVKIVDLKVDASMAAFKSGELDAVVVFQPFLARLETEMGGQIKVFFGEEVYAFRFLLVGKPAYIDSHPEEIQRILRALTAANQFIREQPVVARKAVGEVVKVDDAIMAKLFDPEDYALALDQAMLLALDDQTRWAMQRGLAKAGPIPNYLMAMKYKYLEAVMPTAVRVVR